MSETKVYTVGQAVKGIVTGVTESAMYLEIEEGVKAVIYFQDILNLPKDGNLKMEYQEGSDFAAQVKSIGKDKFDPSITLLTLSTRLQLDEEEAAAKKEALDNKFKAIHEVKDADQIINAKVGKTYANGVELFYNNTKLFLSYKQTDLKEEDFRKMKDQEIPVIVVYIDDEKHSVAVSHNVALRILKKQEKAAEYAALKVGDEVVGEAVSLLQFGAILKFGNISGLLHISEVDHLPVKEITKFIQIGKKYTVKVIKIDGEKVSLSLKAMTQHPWDKLKDQYHIDDVVELKVLKLIPAGIILELTPEYSGLMPKVEYSWNIGDKYDGKVVEGQMLKVKIMSMDDKKHRVSLSCRATEDNAWGSIKARRGETIEVEIAAATDRGATVKFGDIEGFLPISEVDNEKRVTSVTDLYPVGTKVNALVTDCDPNRQKLVVSIKAIQQAAERATFEKYLEDQNNEDTVQTLGELLDLSIEEEPKKKTTKRTKKAE